MLALVSICGDRRPSQKEKYRPHTGSSNRPSTSRIQDGSSEDSETVDMLEHWDEIIGSGSDSD